MEDEYFKARSADVKDVSERVVKLLHGKGTVWEIADEPVILAAKALAPIAGELEIISQRIPADGAYQFATINGNDIILPDFDAARKLLQETIGNT